MTTMIRIGLMLLFAVVTCSPVRPGTPAVEQLKNPLTVIAIGDAGENSGLLRACGTYVTNMHTGAHDGGKFQVLLFLGSNFYPIGLNIPPDDIEGEVQSVLEPFKAPLEDLGPDHVHALAGNHDYYARYAIEKSVLLGLIKIEEAPTGLSDRGNRREASMKEWTYHYGMPAEAVFPLADGSADSVLFLFYDSALPLRTPERLWTPALDSLRRLLEHDRYRPHIIWRIFCAHHPLASAGEHAGFTLWNDETNTVDYLTTCDRDSNALAWLENSFDPEDLCTDRYQAYIDSLRTILGSSGVPFQLALSAHEHSLELVKIPRSRFGDALPRIQVISGASAMVGKVRLPEVPSVYSSARKSPSDKGESIPGFVQLRFETDRLRIVFYDSDNGDRIDMGGGAEVFYVDRWGELLPVRKSN